MLDPKDVIKLAYALHEGPWVGIFVSVLDILKLKVGGGPEMS